MTALPWMIVAIPCAALIVYAGWNLACYLSSARRRRQTMREAAAGSCGVCLWGFNDQGELVHVRVRRTLTGPSTRISADDIPEFLRGPTSAKH